MKTLKHNVYFKVSAIILGLGMYFSRKIDWYNLNLNNKK